MDQSWKPIDLNFTDVKIPEVLCTPMRKYAARAMEHWRKGEITDAALSVELVVFATQMLADTLGIDLVIAIYDKLEINDHRLPTHGGKHPDS